MCTYYNASLFSMVVWEQNYFSQSIVNVGGLAYLTSSTLYNVIYEVIDLLLQMECVHSVFSLSILYY